MEFNFAAEHCDVKGRWGMLVLSRKAGETLLIGDNIKVTINRIAGNRVTVGVEAPGQVKIIRGELEQFPPASAPAKSSTGTGALNLDYPKSSVLAQRQSH
jgi:carbon storage regulator